MVRPLTSETTFPSTLTAYGGSGCIAMAVSSDGVTLAAATDDYINVYPVCSIWVPCISLQIPTKICPINLKMQFRVCKNPDCLYRDRYEPYLKPEKVARRKLGRHRVLPHGTIQILSFFGDKNEFLVGVGPFLLVIYDLTKMDPNPTMTIDMRYFGEDAYSYPYVMQASFTILNIYRNHLYNNKLLSCIDFIFSTRPFVPTYYRVYYNETEKWWFVDCSSTMGILPRDALDEDVPYILYNHDGSQTFTGEAAPEAHSKPENSPPKANDSMELDETPPTPVTENSTPTDQQPPVTTTNTTLENTENETEEFSQAAQSKVMVNLKHNMRDSLNTSQDDSESVSDHSVVDADDNEQTENVENGDKNGDPEAESDDFGADANANTTDENGDTKSTSLDQMYKSNYPYLENSTLEVHGTYYYKIPEKAVYYPFCMLERKFYCTYAALLQYVQDIPDCVLKYRQEFLYSTFIPLASVVVIKLTVENTFYVRSGKMRYMELGKPTVSILTDLVISAVGMKAHTFIARSVGRLFTILFNDRFYVLKYTSSSIESTHLERCSNQAKSDEMDSSTGANETTEKSENMPDAELPVYRVKKVYDSGEDTITVQFCHYDPVLKIRYTVGCFDTSKGDGYLAMCTNYTSQWSLQIYSLSSQSGVDAIRLVLDASKCNGFAHMSWIPFTGKLFVVSRINGELYQLEPKVVRSWVGLIPNFSSIDKNVEFIEGEDTFDLVETSRVDTPKENEEEVPSRPTPHTTVLRNNVSYRYPFTDLGFSLIGNAWLKSKPKPLISQYNAVYHCDEPEIHERFKATLMAAKDR